MWNHKNYRLGFDPWGLGLFLLIMLPSIVWFAFPAPNDILRTESVTPMIDTIAQVLQIIMAAALCLVVNEARSRYIRRGYKIGAALCVVLYFAGWTVYYAGIISPFVVLILCLIPCTAFLLFALARSNAPALLAAVGFTICHLIFATANFVL